MYTVYILSCSDGTFHSGISNDIDKRLDYHQSAKNKDTYTFSRLPVELVFEKHINDVRDAISFEKALRSLSSKETVAVINGDHVLELAEKDEENKSEITEELSITLPSTYLGNIAYYSQLVNQTTLIVDVNELFQKQSYRSRCTILSANGVQNLVVPVIRPEGKNTKMEDILISYAENWQKDHIKAIESAYRRAPYFEYYGADLFAILHKKHEKLIDLNGELTAFIIKAFDMNCSVKSADQNQTAEVEAKILVIPKNRANYKGQPYHQVFESTGGFEANLSILDLLFNARSSILGQAQYAKPQPT